MSTWMIINSEDDSILYGGEPPATLESEDLEGIERALSNSAAIIPDGINSRYMRVWNKLEKIFEMIIKEDQ